MIFKHTKQSGELNADPAKVGGEDWDAQHVVGLHGVVLAGMARFTWNGSTISGVETLGAAHQLYRSDVGEIYLEAYFSSNPVDPNITGTVTRKLIVSPVVLGSGGLPSGYKFNVIDIDMPYNSGNTTFNLVDSSGNPADTSSALTFILQLWLSVS